MGSNNKTNICQANDFQVSIIRCMRHVRIHVKMTRFCTAKRAMSVELRTRRCNLLRTGQLKVNTRKGRWQFSISSGTMQKELLFWGVGDWFLDDHSSLNCVKFRYLNTWTCQAL